MAGHPGLDSRKSVRGSGCCQFTQPCCGTRDSPGRWCSAPRSELLWDGTGHRFISRQLWSPCRSATRGPRSSLQSRTYVLMPWTLIFGPFSMASLPCLAVDRCAQAICPVTYDLSFQSRVWSTCGFIRVSTPAIDPSLVDVQPQDAPGASRRPLGGALLPALRAYAEQFLEAAYEVLRNPDDDLLLGSDLE